MEKKNSDLEKLLQQQNWKRNKKFLFSSLVFLAVILSLIFFVKLLWFSDLRSHTKKIAEPVLDVVIALDSLDGDDISAWKDSIPVVNDLATYLSAGVSVVDTISRNPIFYFRRGMDVLTGRQKKQTIVDTIYVYEEHEEDVQVEELENSQNYPSKKNKGKDTVRVKVRQGEWSADRVRAKLKKEKKYNKRAERAITFIEKYRDEALRHQKLYGIPAPAKMGQALLESNAGASTLAKIANNHFGKKCRCKEKKNKDGEVISRTFSHTSFASGCKERGDDHWYDQFEFYSSVSDSWKAHSALLKGSNGKGRYVNLFKYNDPTKIYPIPLEWQKYSNGKKHGSRNELWAVGLKALGYATEPNYPKYLIELMNTYELDLL